MVGQGALGLVVVGLEGAELLVELLSLELVQLLLGRLAGDAVLQDGVELVLCGDGLKFCHGVFLLFSAK